jgi:myo-inositol-1(or 4)-monophosphatase
LGVAKDISKKDLAYFQEQAVMAVRRVGALLLPKASRMLGATNEEKASLLEEAEEESLACLVDAMSNSFPDHNYLSFKSEDSTPDTKGYLWILDPLVGLTNFIYGWPYYAVSAALLVDGEIVVGNVYNPATDELFTAEKGQGAFLNGKSIAVTDTPELKASFLSTRFPYDIRDGGTTNLGLFHQLIMKSTAVQSDGSATMDLAFVAAGRFDGFWEIRLDPWDLAAGVLLIEEAGGKVSTLSGERYDIYSRELLATNGVLHEEVVAAISEVAPASW